MAISPFSATWRNDIIKALAGLEPLNDTLSAIAALTGEPDKGIYFTGEDSAALFTLTAFARTLLATTDASAALSTLGVSDFAQTLLDDDDASAALTTLGVSAFIQTLLDDADAEAARQTLGANDASNLTQGTIPAARVANLPPDKAYRQGNILGSVSESGGVPTGAIIERGSNANGEYVRFADGTQICLCTVTLSYTITNTLSGQVTFPAVFSSSDYVAVPMVTSFVRSKDEALGSLWYPNNISTTGIGARLASDGHFSSGDNAIVNVSVIGRWF